jgi:hypothetical protein
MGRLFGQCASSLRDWSLLNSPEAATILEEWVCKLELRSARPHRLNRECQDPTVVCVQDSEIQERNVADCNLDC